MTDKQFDEYDQLFARIHAEKLEDAKLREVNEPPTSSGDKFAKEVEMRAELARKTGACVEALRGLIFGLSSSFAFQNALSALNEYDADPLKKLNEALTSEKV